MIKFIIQREKIKLQKLLYNPKSIKPRWGFTIYFHALPPVAPGVIQIMSLQDLVMLEDIFPQIPQVVILIMSLQDLVMLEDIFPQIPQVVILIKSLLDLAKSEDLYTQIPWDVIHIRQ